VSADLASTAAIDIHGHCVPQSFLDEVVRTQPFGVQAELTDGKYLVTFPGRKPLRPVTGVMLDTTDRSGWLASQRVAHQVVAPWLDVHGQDLPAADGARWVALLNDALAGSLGGAEPAGRASQDAGEGPPLSAHATLHLADPDAAAAELARAVRELGMRSAMIPASLPEGRLADRRFDALWAAAVELGVPIVLHPATKAPVNELMARYPTLNGLFGRQIDTTLTAAELIVAGVFDRHPALQLVLVHGGGFLPYQVARFDRDASTGGESRRTPSEVVRSLYYDTVLLSAAAVRFLLDCAGPSQVMVGSDFGAAPRERSGAALTAAVLEASADAASAAAVLAGNARRLFRLS
jgi:aminocarboxymuconate-semialdehyde decarboxylase